MAAHAQSVTAPLIPRKGSITLHYYPSPVRALADAMQHPALRRHSCATKVLVVLYDLLDPERREFRRVKLWYLAQRVGVDRANASRALSHLVAAGLVVCRTAEDGFRTFLLPDPSPAKVA